MNRFSFMRAACLPIVLLQVLSVNAFAAEAGASEAADPYQMNPVIVTATRVQHELKEIPLSVSVVSEEDMKRDPEVSVPDQLAKIPGVQLSGANIAGDRRVMIRGQSAGGTLILIDGVRQPEIRNTAGAGFTIDTNDIERIEVIKGPASVLYGSDAMGGVINIITKKGGDKPIGFRVGAVYDGSTDSFEPSMAVFGSHNGFNYRFSGSGLNADDRKLSGGDTLWNSSYKQRNYRGQIGYDWEKGDVILTAEKYKGENNYTPVIATGDGGFEPAPPNKRTTISEVPQNDREAYTATVTFREISENFRQMRATGYHQELDKRFDYYNYTTGRYSGKHLYEQQAYGGSVQSDWRFFDDHLLSIGFDFDYVELQKYDSYSPFSKTDKTLADQRMMAVFLQDEWEIVPDLMLTLGLRQTWVQTGMAENTAFPNRTDDVSDQYLVGSAGLVYSVTDDLALRALYSQGYKAPTPVQLFAGTSAYYPNPDLKPEESDNFEVGARYSDSIFNVDLALFHNRYKNGIVYEYIPGTSPSRYDTKNVAKAKSWGMELAIDATIPNTGLTPYGSLNLLKYETEDQNGFTTDDTSRAPVWGTVGLRWETDLWENSRLFTDLSLTMSEGAFTRKPDGSKIDKTDSWQRTDFSIGLEGGDEHEYSVVLSLRNIFDEDYQIAAPFSPSSPLPEPGFHVVLSAGYEF